MVEVKDRIHRKKERRESTMAAKERETADERRRRIAEAAYYNAERRGFEGNREMDDWLQAEREIDGRAAGAGMRHEASARPDDPADVAAPAIQEDHRGAGNGEMIEPEQVKQWARKLKVPAARLREAIARVGPGASDVKAFLEKS
jgi:hypothetical protein